jgi:hypothetical protein
MIRLLKGDIESFELQECVINFLSPFQGLGRRIDDLVPGVDTPGY